MDVSKSIVGEFLEHFLLETVSSTICEFLQMSDEEKIKYAKARMYYVTLEHYESKGKLPSFDRFKKNLKYGAEGVYSDGEEIIELNWPNRTLKRKNKFLIDSKLSLKTIKKHQQYAIQQLQDTWDFSEIY